jgi:hypothetical protein
MRDHRPVGLRRRRGEPQRPTIGSTVGVGKARGRVVRYLDDGFAVEFSRVQNPEPLKMTIAPA